MNNIEIPKTFMRKDIMIDGKKAYEEIMNRKDEPEKPKDIKPNLNSNADFWTIDNVLYRNKIYKIDLLKTLLDNGNTKTQDQWTEYSKQAKQNNGFYAGDMPLYHSLFISLHKLKDKPETQEIKDFLKKQFGDKWLITLTRIRYNPKRKDEIIHNYNLQDQYSIQENFMDKDEYVKDSKTPSNYKALLDSDNLNEINEVYKWITGRDAYLWRVNSKSNSIDERVVRFYALSDWADLDCNRTPSNYSSALGVRGSRC